VLQLEPVELQQREGEGGHRQHKPSRGIAGEEDERSWLKVDERDGATPHPPVEPRWLLAEQPPQPLEVILRSETRTREVGRHRYDRWSKLGSSRRINVKEEKAKELRARKQE
jgi:hypothetical protein